MSFCEIVVDASPRDDLERTLRQSQEMARQFFGAHLWVVSYAWPRSSVADALSPTAVLHQTGAMEGALARSEGTFERIFGRTPKDIDWWSDIASPIQAMPDHLFTADLLITSASESDTCDTPDPAELALRTGTPVLRLGRLTQDCRFPEVMVAWKDCAQARRAMHEALPLLERARRVVVVGVGDEVAVERLEAVAEHLRRHLVNARHCHLPRSQESVCADLLVEAQAEGASLIVTGAYSRGPLAERLLGGVTRDMLSSTDLAWFLAS